MLSRIAEALYWTGRYTERAEDTSRLLDIAQRAALEGSSGPSSLGGRDTLAAVLGGLPIEGTRQDVLSHYCLDRASPAAVAFCIRQARENARTIRDAVPTEMWEALNTWHLQVSAAASGDLIGGGAHAFLSTMRSRAYLFSGCADATMVRTEGWQWLMVGRWLERLSFTCRVLGAHGEELTDESGAGSAATSYSWAVLLRALSAYEAYRATYRAGVSPRRVAEFLLLDNDFPRSVRHAAGRLDDAVQLAVEDSPLMRAPRLAGRLRGELDHHEVEEVLEVGVTSFVGRLSALCVQVHSALNDDAFSRDLLAGTSNSGGLVLT